MQIPADHKKMVTKSNLEGCATYNKELQDFSSYIGTNLMNMGDNNF